MRSGLRFEKGQDALNKIILFIFVFTPRQPHLPLMWYPVVVPMSKRSRIVLIHIVAWVVYYVYEHVLVSLIALYDINLIESIFNFPLYIALFYSYVLVIFPAYLDQKRYVTFAVYAILIFGIFTYLRYQVKVAVIPLFSDEELTYPYRSMRLFLAETIYRGGYFLIIAFGHWIATKSVNQEKEKRRLEQQKRKNEQQLRIMETNLKDAEIAYLKNQINPHFLFNTLNFFYDQINLHSERIAEGVLLLSKIMRYALRKSDDAKVMLEDEIEHLKNYIAINQLRFNNQLQIHFHLDGDPAFRLIVPLVLLTFVENCFKYGELFDPEHPVCISMRITNEELAFRTHNKKKDGPIEKSTGIGIDNTKRRLDVIYGDRYDLEIEDLPDFYTATLIISL